MRSLKSHWTILVSLALCLAALGFSVVSHASAAPAPRKVVTEELLQRVLNESEMLVRLNGEPVKIGVLTSSGTSINNSTTAVPFTLPANCVMKVLCDAESWVTPGATASSSATNAAFGHPCPTRVAYWLNLRDSTTQVAMVPTSGSSNCAVFCMQ